MTPETEILKNLVEAEGLRFLGVVPLDVGEDYSRYESWLEEGRHGSMAFLERNRPLRKDPSLLLEGARAAILYALPYDQGDMLEENGSPRVAQYARFRDYHRILWDKGEKIAEGIREAIDAQSTCRVMTDSAPVLERALAARTAKGFIGKNTCFIDPEAGSFLLLGEILTTTDLSSEGRRPRDSRVRDATGGCGTCDLCQVVCPTGALDSDYSLDTKKCLAYWTIEHRGPVPEAFWPHFKTYWFGCDLCQLACPYNRRVRGHALPKELEIKRIPSLDRVAKMTQKEYEAWFGGTSLTRARREGLKRNALIALFEMGDPSLPTVLENLELESDEGIRATVSAIQLKTAATPD